MHTLEVSVTTDGEGAETVALALHPFAQDECIYFEQWQNEPGKITVKVYVSADNDTPDLRNRIEKTIYYLGRLYPMPAPVFAELQTSEWKDQTQSLRVDKHWLIQPSDQPHIDTQESDIVLTLDAKSAFGTGLHPSTYMCLSLIEKFVQPGMRVLDVGTGSGILAIAAAKLNATAYGVDIDATSIIAAKENVRLNDVSTQVTLESGELKDVSEKNWDLVIANITPKVLEFFLREEKIMDYVSASGHLMLSGINEPKAALIESAISDANGQIIQTSRMGKDWLAFVVAHS